MNDNSIEIKDEIEEKINKLSAEEKEDILRLHFEDIKDEAESAKFNLEEAPEIAEKLINIVFCSNLYPMDIWEAFSNMFESMCERSQLGWYDSVYIRAIVPAMIERIPEANEVFTNAVNALEKRLETDKRREETRTSQDFNKVTENDSVETLSRLLSDLAKNPAVPKPMADGLIEGINDVFNGLSDQEEFGHVSTSPEYVAEVIRGYNREKKIAQ